MLFPPLLKRYKRMVDKVILELNRSSLDDNMLIHDLHIASTITSTEQPPNLRRVHTSLYPAIAEPSNNMPSPQHHAIILHLQQLDSDFRNQFISQILVCNQPQNPSRLYLMIVNRLLELNRLIHQHPILNNQYARSDTYSTVTPLLPANAYETLPAENTFNSS